MKKNQFEVKYIDDEQIILEEDKRKLLPFSWFFFKYGRLITMIFASIAILTFVGGVALTLSKLPHVTPPVITNPGVIMEFDKSDNIMNVPYNAITKDYAEMLFENIVNGSPIDDKFLDVVEVINVGADKILIFENGSAVIIYGDKNKLPIYIEDKDNVKVEDNKIVINGDYVKVIDKNTLPDGTIVYEFENEKLLIEKDDEYRLIDKEDIIYDKDGNILEDTKKEEDNENNIVDIIEVGNDKILIFEDDDAVVIYGDKDKLPVYIPDKDDVKAENGYVVINGDGIETIEKDVLPNGIIIYEFNNDKLLVEDDDEYKLFDKDKGHDIAEVEVNNDKIIYFDNGVAVVVLDDKLPQYVENRDNVVVDNNKIIIEGEASQTDKKKKLPDGTIVYEFENGKVMIDYDKIDYKIDDIESLNYDDAGNLIDKSDDMSLIEFSVKNNTDEEVLKYRVVLEETQKYNTYNKERLLPEYIYYKMSVNNNIQPTNRIDNSIWEKGSVIEGDLKVKNNTYILYEGEVQTLAVDKFKLGIWLDYETLGNDMQDKWFIGTIKVYAWMENKNS